MKRGTVQYIPIMIFNVEKLENKMNDLKHSTLHKDMENLGSAIKDKALEAGDVLKNKAISLSHDTMDKAMDTQEYLLSLVRDNPYKSIAVAFLAGYILAKCHRKP